jgi:glycosyltransferase involved in cell wall biosynthesis
MYGVVNHLRLLHGIIYKLRVERIADNILLKIFKCKYGGLYRRQIRESDKTVLLSEKFINEMEYFSDVYDSSKISAIPNPVTIDIPKKPFEKKKEVLFVGRLSFEKRVDLLLSVWNKVSKNYPEWSLRIVGDGEERKKMESMAKGMNLSNVSFEGFQAPKRYYETASIFCMTSSFEGFGLVLVEAMAYEVVPMAFNSYANVSDIIDDGISGILITPFSIEEYAKKLSGLMNDAEKRNEMAKRAKIKSEIFSIENISKKWFELFEKL